MTDTTERDTPCPECGRGVHKDGSHTLACSRRGTERYAKVDVVAPDGSVEDSVKVQFDYEQPLGIHPLKHDSAGRWANEYKLELRYIVIDGEVFKS